MRTTVSHPKSGNNVHSFRATVMDSRLASLAGSICAVLAPLSASAQIEVRNVTEVECDGCRIHLEPVLTLGDADGPGMLESEFNVVARDSRGMYYVSGFVSYFWVFDADGRILHRIGRQGEGPGEYDRVSRILVDGADSLHVLDSGLGRTTVYSSSFEPVRTIRWHFPNRGVNNAIFVGPRVVINTGIQNPDHVGFPLHLLDEDGRIVRSFGSESGVYRPDRREIINMRAVTAADDLSVWSGWINQYVIERWDTAGHLTQAIRRDVDWYPTWWVPTGDAFTPPVAVMMALRQEGDTLWVMVRIPDPNWRSAVRPRGRRYTVDDRNGYQDTMIEAIDLPSGQVLASTRFSQVMNGFLGSGLVYANDYDANGNPIVRIWRFRIVHDTPTTRRK